MPDMIPGPSSEALTFMLDEKNDGFTPFDRALAGLGGDDAVRRPTGSPHSPAEVLAHIVFWQERLLRIIDGEPPGKVETAAVGWPAVTADEWAGLVERCLAVLERYRALARDPAELERPLVEGHRSTVGAAVATHFVHDSHHLGQIVLLRRMLGAWPPPGGGDSW